MASRHEMARQRRMKTQKIQDDLERIQPKIREGEKDAKNDLGKLKHQLRTMEFLEFKRK